MKLTKSFIITGYNAGSNQTSYTTYDWQGQNVGGSYAYRTPDSFSFVQPGQDGFIGTFDYALAEQWRIPYVERLGGDDVQTWIPPAPSTGTTEQLDALSLPSLDLEKIKEKDWVLIIAAILLGLVLFRH